jgi:hypothetical protein
MTGFEKLSLNRISLLEAIQKRRGRDVHVVNKARSTLNIQHILMISAVLPDLKIGFPQIFGIDQECRYISWLNDGSIMNAQAEGNTSDFVLVVSDLNLKFEINCPD